MIIRASLMIAATVAALTICSRTRKRQRDEPESPEQRSCERRDEETERTRLLAKDLRKRKLALEKRLLELHDTKEEYQLMGRLWRKLRVKCSEVESLENKVRELRDERNVLEEEMRKSASGVEELRSARSMIMGLQERIDSIKKGMGEMVRTVEVRVDVIQRNDGRCDEGMRIGKEEEEDCVNDVKMEVLELQQMNKELEIERRELASKSDAARVKICGLLSRIENERETFIELKKEEGSLRRANEDLRKRVDQLQKKRFGMVEELVYMRWLNICLRFEAEDFYSISQKNPMDSSHCDYRREWSTEYIEKTGRILCAVSEGSDSSQTSTESSGISNSTAKSSSSSGENKKKPSNLIHQIKFWGRGKKNSNGDSPLLSDENTAEVGRRIRRYSMSMIPGRRATTTESSDNAKGLSRLRRVSFNDAVRNSEPLFGSSTMAPKATAGADEPNFRTPAAETNEVVHQNISAKNRGGGHKQNLHEEMVRAVAEVGAVDAATGVKIGKLSMVIVFLIFISMITLYYRIF